VEGAMCSPDVIDLISSSFKGAAPPEDVIDKIKILKDKLEHRKDAIQATLDEIRKKIPGILD
jgi:hypothetical protein